MGRRVGAGLCLGQHLRPPWRYTRGPPDRALSPGPAQFASGRLSGLGASHVGPTATRFFPIYRTPCGSFFPLRGHCLDVGTVSLLLRHPCWRCHRNDSSAGNLRHLETLVAWFFLGERIPRYAVVGVFLIFVGLVTLSWGQSRGHPTSPLWYWAIPLAFCTALTYGVSGVLWRDGQLRGAHQSTAIFLQFTTSVLVGLVGLIALGRGPALLDTNWHSLLALLASGVLSGILAIYCLFTALRLMAVARVYAFSSLTPLVATLFAHFFLHEFLNGLVFGGVVLVSIGVILTQVFRPTEERQA